jgi:hypothetical protein
MVCYALPEKKQIYRRWYQSSVASGPDGGQVDRYPENGFDVT